MQLAASASPTYPCVTCGSHGHWHGGRQEVVCPSCAAAVVLPAPSCEPVAGVEFLPLLRDRPDSGRDWQAAALHVQCAVCQAITRFAPGVSGRACEACGSPALVPCQATGAPFGTTGVVPFALTANDARERFTSWLANRSGERQSRRRAAIDDVAAAYVPCWIFQARVFCRYRGERHETNRRGEVERVAFDGSVERAFDDVLVPASGSLAPKLLKKVAEVQPAEVRAYDPRYLAGAHVEVYATNLWDAWDAASARMDRDLQAKLRGKSGASPSSLETWPEWSGHRCLLVLVPVFVLTCRRGRETFPALVAGTGGSVAAALPPDRLSGLVSLAILLVVAAALLYGAFRLIVGLLRILF